jgi:hypothetical protein
MISPTFEMLNQRGTPMFFSDTLANRPPAAIVGRIFVSIDTFELYRDTGTTWDLLSGPGTGTITGSGTAFKYPVFTASGVIGNGSIEQFTTENLSTKNFSVETNSNDGFLETTLKLTNRYFGNPDVFTFEYGRTLLAGSPFLKLQGNDPIFTTSKIFVYPSIMELSDMYINVVNSIGNQVGNFNASAPELTIGATGVSQRATLILAPSIGAFAGTIKTGSALNTLEFQTGIPSVTRLEIGATGTISFFGNLSTTLNQNAATGLTISNSTSGTAANSFLKLQTTNASTYGEFAKLSALYTTYKIFVGNDLAMYNTNTSGDIAILNDFATGKIKFAAGGSTTSQLTLDSNGRLGINATSPAAIFDVNGLTDATSTARFLHNVAFPTLILGRSATRNAAFTWDDGLAEAKFETFALSFPFSFNGSDIKFLTNNINRARIFNSTGNLLLQSGGSFIDSGQRLQVTGTAYLSDSVGIGSTSLTGYNLRISKAITQVSSGTGYGIVIDGTIDSTVTTSAQYFRTSESTTVSVNYTDIVHYVAAVTSQLGNVTNRYGFNASSSLGVGAGTNIFGFYGNIAAANSRWNLYMNGTAANYINGDLGIGVSINSAGAKLQIDSTTKGFLPPRMTSVERNNIGTLVAGLMVYDTTLNKLYVYTNAWEQITSI